MTELDAEDSKLVVLARGAMGRSGGSEGAAVRDLDGRTYAAGQVVLATLNLSAGIVELPDRAVELPHHRVLAEQHPALVRRARRRPR